MERGEGRWVWDLDGNRLLDMIQGDWLLPPGHCNPKVTAADIDRFLAALERAMRENGLIAR